VGQKSVRHHLTAVMVGCVALSTALIVSGAPSTTHAAPGAKKACTSSKHHSRSRHTCKRGRSQPALKPTSVGSVSPPTSTLLPSPTTVPLLRLPWHALPGAAHAIGIGADGSVWVIGSNPVMGGYGIFHWTGSRWDAIDGGAVAIAVGPSGRPWVVAEDGSIWERVNDVWQNRPGAAHAIGIGADGSVWVIGSNPVMGGYGIFHWSGSRWDAIDGGAVAIAVGPSGRPWVVAEDGSIWERVNDVWQNRPGAAHAIGIGADGSVWVIGTDSVPGGYGVFQWTGKDFERTDGGAVTVAVDQRGEPWVVTDASVIFTAEVLFAQVPQLRPSVAATNTPAAVPTATATATPTSAPVAAIRPALTVQAWVDPPSMPYDFYPTLYARTLPGTHCTADVQYNTGRSPTSFDGGDTVAGANGIVSWSWHEETQGDGGTAFVTCSANGASQFAQATFSVA